MFNLKSGGRAALLVGTGLVLGALVTARAGDLGRALAQNTPQASAQHGRMGDGSAGRQMGNGTAGPGGHQMGGGAAGMGSMQGDGSHAGTTMDVGRHFIEWMIPHHQDAVTMSDLAPTQAEHPELRALAAHIKDAQTDEISRMRGWYQDWYGTEVPANTMAGGMMSMTSDTPLDGATPFDKAFIEQMIPHHEMAVMGSTMALQRVGRPELRDLLQSIITSQSAEIAQMRDWYQQWYGAPVPQSSGMSGHGMMGGMGEHQTGGMGGHQMGNGSPAEDRQQSIHEHGSTAMPFDLDQTTHHFQALPDGGLQTITVNDPTNQAQISLVQQHLAEEAARFQEGDFSDPATLHGAAMPGLAELSAAGSRLQVVYSATADGAQIRFTTEDPKTLAALHQWFAAQLADHGHDAVAD